MDANELSMDQPAAAHDLDDAILQEQVENRDTRAQTERAVVLRVYNYFRIVLAFALLILFFEVPDQTFVGTLEPLWFQDLIFLYLAFNILAGFLVLVNRASRFTEPSAISSMVVLDIFFLSLLLLTSGGIESGLGYLLVFSVAFGSVMIRGQVSFLFPAIAVVNCISTELYLDNTGGVEGSQHFFEAALLGVSFFVVNFFFQYVSKLIDEREQEVVSLESLNRMHRLAEQSRHDLEVANDRFNALLRSTEDGVLVVDMSGSVTFANPKACEYLQIDHAQLVASDVQRFFHPVQNDPESPPQQILKTLGILPRHDYDPQRWQTAKGDAFVVDYTCEVTHDAKDEPAGAVVLFRNITEQWENEEKLQYLANYDELTGLANRTNFKEVLRNRIARTNRTDRSLAVMIVDTDHFTVVNEQLGEDAGDRLLKVIAERLAASIREGDLVARFHADQFAIMLVDLDHAENSAIAADKINRAMVEPLEIYGRTVNLSASIGIAVIGDEHEDADDMISAATSAVQLAKQHGRDTYRFYQADMQRKADEKKRIQILLRTAAENDEFRLFYQPIVSIRDECMQSCEALIRWIPRGEDPIRPDIFIPIAEESGQIIGVGSWVLQTVFQQVRDWKELLGSYPPIAINVSSKQLRDHQFREQFQDALSTYEIPVDVVEMELTETGVMEDPATSLQELQLLRDLGVKISIDDFGTGYSSLDYLRRLPLDLLKIDQSFTRGIGVSDNDEEIVRVMIRMAHAMGLGVICEGVETSEQLEFLRDHDCEYAQGYYFSKPKTVEEATQLFVAAKAGTVDIMAGSV